MYVKTQMYSQKIMGVLKTITILPLDSSSRVECSSKYSNDIEDEFHFSLICPIYSNIKKS